MTIYTSQATRAPLHLDPGADNLRTSSLRGGVIGFTCRATPRDALVPAGIIPVTQIGIARC